MFSKGDKVKYVGDDTRFEGIVGVVSSVEDFDDDSQVVRVDSEQAYHGFILVGGSELEISEEPDPVNHPAHYTWLPGGVEVIDITEQFNFRLGNALKYILRSDQKGKRLEDLKKARWYLDREIAKTEEEA